MSSAKAAAGYIRRGLAPVPIPPGRKGPNLPDWQDLRVRLEDVPRYFANGQNIGLLLGKPSGWRVDVDVDAPEAVKVAGRFLPPTLTSGRETAPHSHWWYRCAGARTEKWKDLDGDMLVELRSTGCQTVVAPSVHPEGDRYLWHEGLEVAEASAGELAGACRELATAALVARHLPPVGGRHDFALALVGYLLRRLEAESVRRIVHAAWDAAGDAGQDAHADLDGIIRDTAEKLGVGEQVIGGPRLDEFVPGVLRLLVRWYGRGSSGPASDEPPPSANGHGAADPPGRFNLTDIGNAERFTEMCRGRVLWCPVRKSFLLWDDVRWAWDERMAVLKLAHRTARGIYKEAEREPDPEKQKQIARFALASQNEGRLSAMLSQAKPYLAVGIAELDRDPWLINCQNGTLDLRTGRLKDHDPADLITKVVPVDYDPSADCPRFRRFLKETLVDDAVITFIKRYSGYTMSGSTRERILAILYGFGKNGKTTLVELVREALGDYATNTDVETLLMRKYQGVGNDIAALKGARFVSAAEVEKGRHLAESKVKQLTGRDTVTARFLFCEPFNFRPEFKLWLSTNNKPVVQGSDDAIWDRLKLVPFTQRFEGDAADPKLPEKLREELPGVFAWMVEGCLEWQEHGLQEPESVSEATRQYRAEMDTLAAFIEERCVLRNGTVAPATPLYKQYQLWCDDAGEKPETQKMFGMRLRERGFESVKIRSGPHKDRKGWLGIGIRADHPDPDTPPEGDRDAAEGSAEREDGPPGGASAEDRPQGGKCAFAGELPSTEHAADHSGPKTKNPQSSAPRVERDSERRSASSASSANDVRTAQAPTGEQRQRMRQLVHEGMAERTARLSVLGDPADHPLSCECEDCL